MAGAEGRERACKAGAVRAGEGGGDHQIQGIGTGMAAFWWWFAGGIQVQLGPLLGIKEREDVPDQRGGQVDTLLLLRAVQGGRKGAQALPVGGGQAGHQAPCIRL